MSEVKRFNDLDVSEISSFLSVEPVSVKKGTKVKPALLYLPSGEGHISFRSQLHPKFEEEGKETTVTFFRKYGTDEDGRINNSDYVLNNGIPVFGVFESSKQLHVVLNNKENGLTEGVTWVTFTRERASVQTVSDLNDAPHFVKQTMSDITLDSA